LANLSEVIPGENGFPKSEYWESWGRLIKGCMPFVTLNQQCHIALKTKMWHM